MRRFFKIAIVAALALPLVCSCSDSSKKELAGLVRELADKDFMVPSFDHIQADADAGTHIARL